MEAAHEVISFLLKDDLQDPVGIVEKVVVNHCLVLLLLCLDLGEQKVLPLREGLPNHLLEGGGKDRVHLLQVEPFLHLSIVVDKLNVALVGLKGRKLSRAFHYYAI